MCRRIRQPDGPGNSQTRGSAIALLPAPRVGRWRSRRMAAGGYLDGGFHSGHVAEDLNGGPIGGVAGWILSSPPFFRGAGDCRASRRPRQVLSRSSASGAGSRTLLENRSTANPYLRDCLHPFDNLVGTDAGVGTPNERAPPRGVVI